MINYIISYKHPHRHYVDFKLETNTNSVKNMRFQLAAWRPGRYELGNFSQNIRNWCAFDENGVSLNFKKINKDLWEVDTKNTKKISVTYSYYSNQLDAGSCYLDEFQLYLNPVQCCFYIPGRIDEKYNLIIEKPDNYKIASSLEINKNKLISNGYEELAESPIICSSNLQKNTYEVNNTKFHIWFQGECKVNRNKIMKDFSLFTQKQINHFEGFPVNEYHFLFQITPYKSYHGVEHTKNTVILLGPSDQIMNERYEDLLGVCSHELYHTWNIKSIRPKELLPYDYTKENYFRTGFVAEGVTTYMGDLTLYTSGVFSWKEFIKTQNQNLDRHLMNYGRFNLSVADSGFDSWLDGYKLGAPDRKVSIYPDAALCMLMVDLEIIINSNGKFSLHSVMKDLYHNFGLKNIGYSELDFQKICIKFGGTKVSKIFKDHIYDTKNYIPTLNSLLSQIGLELIEKKNPNLSAQYFGFITIEENNKIIIKKIEPNSAADNQGIGCNDEIVEIENKCIDDNLNNILKKCNEKVIFKIRNKFSEKIHTIKIGNYYKLLEIKKIKKINNKQIFLQKKWLN